MTRGEQARLHPRARRAKKRRPITRVVTHGALERTRELRKGDQESHATPQQKHRGGDRPPRISASTFAVSRSLFEIEGATVTVASVRTGRVRSRKAAPRSSAKPSAGSIRAPSMRCSCSVVPEPKFICGPTKRCTPSSAERAPQKDRRCPLRSTGRARPCRPTRWTQSGRRHIRAARDELRRANVTLQPDAVVREENVITGAGETSAWADEVIRAPRSLRTSY